MSFNRSFRNHYRAKSGPPRFAHVCAHKARAKLVSPIKLAKKI